MAPMQCRLMLPQAFFSLVVLVVSVLSIANAELQPGEYKPHPNHLCAKITQGHFNRIHLKSITFYKDEKVLLFEDTNKYYIERELINTTALPLSSFNHHDWDDGELHSGVQQMVSKKRLHKDEVTAVYLLYFGDAAMLDPGKPNWESANHLGSLRWDRTKLAAVLYTNGTIYTMDIVNAKEPSLYRDHQNNHPEFAIIQEQKGGRKAVDGYVINRDIYDRTNNLVIYDLTTSYRSLKVRIHRKSKITQAEIDSAAFYYLEKGTADNEILLVHRQRRQKTPADEKAQLSSAVPRGFRLGANVYLVDSTIGCVYLLKGLTMRLSDYYKKSQENIRIKVVGIPFERFFVCSHVQLVEPYPHAGERCQLSRSRPPPLEPLNVTMPLSTTEEEDNTTVWLIFVFVVVLVLIGLVSLFAYKYICGRQWELLPLTSMKPHSRSALLHKLALEKRGGDKRKSSQMKTKMSNSKSNSNDTSKSPQDGNKGAKNRSTGRAIKPSKKNSPLPPPPPSRKAPLEIKAKMVPHEKSSGGSNSQSAKSIAKTVSYRPEKKPLAAATRDANSKEEEEEVSLSQQLTVTSTTPSELEARSKK